MTIAENSWWEGFVKELTSMLPVCAAVLQDRRTMLSQEGSQVEVVVANQFSANSLRDKQDVIQGMMSHYSGEEIKMVVRLNGSSVPVQEVDAGPEINHEAPAGEAVLPQTSLVSMPSRHTFDNYVVGDNNRLAHALAMALAQGRVPVPVFLHGFNGRGKTHLLRAALHLFGERTGLIGEYSTAEWFLNAFFRALKENDKYMPSFRRRFREAAILAVDDIQFFAGKDRTTEEFLHILIERCERRLPTILGSAEPMDRLKFPPALLTRLQASYGAEVGLPSEDMRVEIVLKKAEERGMRFTKEWAMAIVQRTEAVRDMEGELNRIQAHIECLGRTLDDALIAELCESKPVFVPTVTPESIVGAVAAHHGLSVAELKSKRRTKEIVDARWDVIQLIRRLHPGSTWSGIGQVLGQDHTTILNGWRKGLAKAESREGKQKLEAIVCSLRRA